MSSAGEMDGGRSSSGDGADFVELYWRIDPNGSGRAVAFYNGNLEIMTVKYLFQSLDSGDLPPAVAAAIRADGRASGQIPDL